MKHQHNIAALRQLLHGMEQEFGFDHLTPAQRDVLYAASLISEQGDVFTTGELRSHPMVKSIAKPTFFRILKALVDDGFLMLSKDALQGSYSLNPSRKR